MLALQRTRLRHTSVVATARPFSPRHRHPRNRRFFVQNLCNGFLDLAIALPLPPSLPPYSTTIILVTLVTRFALLPISIKSKQYSRRIEETVMPEIEKLKPAVSKRVFEEMKKSGMRGDKKFLQEFHAKKSLELLKIRQQQLLNEHNFHPIRSMLLPPLSQLPVFLMFTIVLSRLSMDPTPFDSEAFLTLSTLAHPDPTMTLPIVLGVLTMANVETSQWVMNAEERAQLRKIEEAKAQKIAAGGKPVVEPGKLIKTGMRGLSIIRIIIAALAPGSVALYWVTSAGFGLIQTWVMDALDAKRRRILRPLSDVQSTVSSVQLSQSPSQQPRHPHSPQTKRR
ncbi:60Kd inner membrane protein-domain-containing protein [Crucibulum laeve]|uniref:60Kd inner membrane protein-domain-containing protein n=1 Tax=Crucibulum laeve TaxID=68775 RepID=A0A5C3MHM4_9AGAR|nr:60Kd inner membrane protein-domain-containing protein [Crucibulum laeve]